MRPPIRATAIIALKMASATPTLIQAAIRVPPTATTKSCSGVGEALRRLKEGAPTTTPISGGTMVRAPSPSAP